MGKRPKHVCQSLTLNFKCLFTFNLVSLHALSRLIQVNLLHAEVSYIIDIACHWIFFPILPALAAFWIAKTPIFFPFSNSEFFRTIPVELMFTNIANDYWAKTAIGPYCGIVWVLFYNIKRFSMKICTISQNQD